LKKMYPKNTKPTPNPNELKTLLSFYQKKKLFDAEKLAQSIANKFPRHPYAWKILAAVLDQTNRIPESLNIFLKVLALSPKDPEIHLGIGNALKALGRPEEAIKSYNEAIILNKKNFQAYFSLALTLREMGRYEDSSYNFKKVISLEPKFAQAHYNLGLNLKELGELDQALLSYKQAIIIKPDYYQAFYNSANILKNFNKFDEAVESYKKAISLKPDFAEAYNNLGMTLKEIDRYEEALDCLKHAILLKPKYPLALYNLGIIFKDIRKFDEAVESYKKAISLKPDFAEAYNNLGNTLYDLDKFEEALDCLKQAILLKPKYPEAYFGLANTLKDLRRLEEAFINYEKAISLKPNYAEALHNWGRALLLNNNFEKANQLMEWRWQTDQKIGNFFDTIRPKWDGKINQNILLWREQGIGDEIMFSASIYDLNAKSNNLLIECDQRLIPLFQRSLPDNIEYVADKNKVGIDNYDCHLPIGSLPSYFRKSIDSFKKTSKGWLKADDKLIEELKNIINKNPNEKIIGISWKSKSSLSKANYRNIKLQDLVESIRDSGIKIINLQYGNVSDEILKLSSEIGLDVLEISGLDIFNDLDRLAALITVCDCVVSIDNIIPHLAGALGIDTRLLLPHVSDERWGTHSKKSYLYDSVKFYRQIEKGDWSYPLSDLTQDLKNLFNV
jgi:tetratricopeptide (TPR) repeat protein